MEQNNIKKNSGQIYAERVLKAQKAAKERKKAAKKAKREERKNRYQTNVKQVLLGILFLLLPYILPLCIGMLEVTAKGNLITGHFESILSSDYGSFLYIASWIIGLILITDARKRHITYKPAKEKEDF